MTPRREGISPKDFAAAIGVSESSIKRWVDQGLLRAVRTAGGHRRIAPDEAQRWIREHRVKPVRPELLGDALPADTGTLGDHVETFFQHLLNGRTLEARALALRLFLGGHAVHAIADELVVPAMSRIGALHEINDEGIVTERRATDVAVHVAKDLDGLVAEHRSRTRGLVAVGGALAGDPYLLAPMYASVVLAEVGFAATSLGPETPSRILELAAQKLGARLVWINISVPPSAAMVAELRQAVDRLLGRDMMVALHGRHVAATGLVSRPGLEVGQSFGQLASFGRGIAPAPVRPPAIAR